MNDGSNIAQVLHGRRLRRKAYIRGGNSYHETRDERRDDLPEGRVSIPKGLRDDFGIRKGDRLEFSAERDGIKIRKHVDVDHGGAERQHPSSEPPSRVDRRDARMSRQAEITVVDTDVILDVLNDDPRFASASIVRCGRRSGALMACDVVWGEVGAWYARPEDAAYAMDRFGVRLFALDP